MVYNEGLERFVRRYSGTCRYVVRAADEEGKARDEKTIVVARLCGTGVKELPDECLMERYVE